jgi:hypothetical protein
MKKLLVAAVALAAFAVVAATPAAAQWTAAGKRCVTSNGVKFEDWTNYRVTDPAKRAAIEACLAPLRAARDRAK